MTEIAPQTDPRDAELGPAYECWICGEHFQPSQRNEKPFNDGGERSTIMVCDGCLAVGATMR